MLDPTRHIGIFNASHLDVCLIGAGGIGAITAMTLGKMGVHTLDIYDDDRVDQVNLATQFHQVSDVGLCKALTVARSTRDFSLGCVNGYPERVGRQGKLRPADVFISAVDSIASRQAVWHAVKNTAPVENPSFPNVWYLDARMGAEVFELFAVNMKDPDWYEANISRTHDVDLPDLPCTSKATIYTANIAAGHIGVAVRRILTLSQKPGFLTHHILNNQITFLEMEG